MKYFLAIDIGASGGRHILGCVRDEKIETEEVYRFENGCQQKNGQLIWDTDLIFSNIIEGMRRCKDLEKTPVSVGIDTWGVDFALLDENGMLVAPVVCYRDQRTQGTDEIVEKCIPFAELYKKTGVQKQIYNTIYQLTAIKRDRPEALDRAKTFLTLPNYFNFLLSGIAINEYTHATTTAMVGATEKTWDRDIIKRLGLPQELFTDLAAPGSVVGVLTERIQNQVGYNCEVVLPPCHDTASAYIAAPTSEKEAIYLSSGTWSLMGIESDEPITSEYAMQRKFTNEGGYAYRFRFLKNIMGLWMLQSVSRETEGKYSFPELARLAKESGSPVAIVDVEDNAFFAPESMIDAIKDAARKTGQTIPETLGQVVQCIYHSLAKCYADTAVQLERVTGRKFSSLHTFGGGSQDEYLNLLTANQTGLDVYAGPTEATAIGNLMVQMLAKGEISNIDKGKTMIRNSFPISVVQSIEKRL